MALQMSRRKSPTGRVAYVDGRYLPHAAACVHVEDRGLQFADSVYEVCAVNGGLLMDEAGHLNRLERSLKELAMKLPMQRPALKAVMRETLRRNRLKDGLLYLQVTRGAYRRDHVIPDAQRPSLIVTARAIDPQSYEKRRAEGIAVATVPDIRWGRCDIKTTGLLPNVLAKTKARQAGAYEAWLVDAKGCITEGSSTNAWIVTKDDVLITRDLASNILAGVTRAGVFAALSRAGINAVEERAFTLAEAHAAREAFISSASGGVLPVVRIDGRPVGDGKPGPTTLRIHSLYREHAAEEARSEPGVLHSESAEKQRIKRRS
jgi:D-alanine transaminase